MSEILGLFSEYWWIVMLLLVFVTGVSYTRPGQENKDGDDGAGR